MSKRRIRISEAAWQPKAGDSDAIAFAYSLIPQVPGSAGAPGIPDSGYVTVDISRTLSTMWHLDRAGVAPILLEYAKQHLSGKIADSSLSSVEEIQLSSSNAPWEPPFDPSQLPSALPLEFDVHVPEAPPPDEIELATLASQVIDLRDNINALYGERHNTRLLTLPQERALLELSRPCATREEFAFRLSSLCGLATAIDTSGFDRLLGAADGAGSLDKFSLHLRQTYPGDSVERVIQVLVNLNRLRRMFPIHSDRAGGVIQAAQYFGLEFPVTDYQPAMLKLLASYRDALRDLLSLFE